MPFVGRDRGCVAEDSNQVALAAGFDPQNAEPVIFVVEGNALDQSG
jgi:hypothetical protein